ncbi:hypothetical protein PI126_g10438 [Phytophthora idaei]|nr:hypothetical protein PI126_g10438 [Phytophthora idaei]
MEVLLDRGADVNARDNEGSTPLMHVCLAGNPDPSVVQLLVDHGANRCRQIHAHSTGLCKDAWPPASPRTACFYA